MFVRIGVYAAAQVIALAQRRRLRLQELTLLKPPGEMSEWRRTKLGLMDKQHPRYRTPFGKAEPLSDRHAPPL